MEGQGGKGWEFGISRGKLLYTGWINKLIRYSIGNCIQNSMTNHNEKEYEKRDWVTSLFRRNEHTIVINGTSIKLKRIDSPNYDLQSSSWWAGGVVPICRPAASGPRKSQYFSLSLKAGWKPSKAELPLTQGETGLFYSSLQLIRWGPPKFRVSSLLSLVYWFKCQCHQETPSQTDLE